jgi:multiple sugar transport system ATP-binding protein
MLSGTSKSRRNAAASFGVRKEIRAIHDRLHGTSVYVTHDQIAAMTMADQVVVMRDGIIEQQGKPLDLYDTPVNKFVARSIEYPAMNFIPATVVDDATTPELDLGTIKGATPWPPS